MLALNLFRLEVDFFDLNKAVTQGSPGWDLWLIKWLLEGSDGTIFFLIFFFNGQYDVYITYNTIQSLTPLKYNCLHYLQYNTTTHAALQLISITNTTITNYTWNKIKLLLPLKTFTP